MNTIASSEIKRRGIGAVDELLGNGPVHIIRNNTPDYVILTEESYKMIIDDLISARCFLQVKIPHYCNYFSPLGSGEF